MKDTTPKIPPYSTLATELIDDNHLNRWDIEGLRTKKISGITLSFPLKANGEENGGTNAVHYNFFSYMTEEERTLLTNTIADIGSAILERLQMQIYEGRVAVAQQEIVELQEKLNNLK